MKKIITISFILLQMVGYNQQVASQSLSEQQTELISHQVDSIFRVMITLAERLDFDTLSEGVDDTEKAGFLTNGKYYTEYSTLIEQVKQNSQGVSRQEISVNEKKLTVLSDKVVLLTATGVSKAYLEDEREIVANFQWSFVYRKIEDKWKVIFSHQSTAR